MRWCVASLWLVSLLTTFAPIGAAEPAGRLVVKVTVEGTGEPLPGAKVLVNLGILEPSEVEEKRVTDASGKCEIAVPWGHLRLIPPAPPLGYCMPRKNFSFRQPFESIAITREQATIEREFVAVKGVLWPVKVVSSDGKPIAGVRIHGTRQPSGRKDLASGGVGRTSDSGEGQLTVPPDGGEVTVSCGFVPNLGGLTRKVAINIDSGFRPDNVVRQAPAAAGDRIELVDGAGHKALCEGCRVELRDRVAQLVLEAANSPDTSMLTEVVGRVVDQSGMGISGATVTCHGNVLTIEEYRKKSDENGAFRIRGAFQWSPPSEIPAFAIIASKEGYTGAKVTHLFTADADGTMRLKDPLVLEPGFAARVQVLGAEGQPLEGAWAEFTRGDYNNVKSDAQGLCALRNLPEGTTSVRFSYGVLAGSAKIAAGPATADAPPVVVRLRKADFFAPPTRPRLQPLAVGEMAPQWSIRQWIDDNERTLAALEGRVVVIGFWDWGCGPCRKITMPVESRLAPKYAKDVTFIYIHPATDEPHLVKEIIQKEGWNLVVGIDEGTGPTDSVTLKRYGVAGFPTEFIVDRNGRVVDNGDLGATAEEKLAKMRVLAEEAELPWPLEKDASEEETIRRMQRFHEHWMTKRIEAALAKE